MAKRKVNLSIHYLGVSPVALVSCIDKQGKPNIITIGAIGFACPKPPILGMAITPRRYSHRLIKESGEFVVNIPSADQVNLARYCGSTSGRDADKFKGAKLTPEPSSQLKTPLIRECPINIECKVRNIVHLGSHDYFFGEIIAVHVEEGIMDKEGNIDPKKLNPLIAFWPGKSEELYWNLGEGAIR